MKIKKVEETETTFDIQTISDFFKFLHSYHKGKWKFLLKIEAIPITAEKEG